MPCCGGRIVQRAKLLLLLAVFMGTSEGSCSKTVIFIRHGQAEHNILLERGQRDQARKILDPPLSALGVQQAEALRENSLLLDALSGPHDPLVVVSPLRRTLQTAIGGLGAWARDKEGRRLICIADLQETGEVACDSGSPDISTNFAGELDVLDFSQLEDGWERKDGINKDLPVPLKTRLTRFQEWLAKRPERRVVVVAHHNVFLALLRVSFFNCEVRKYEFDPASASSFGACFTPIEPLISTCDDELDETSRSYHKQHYNYCKGKLEGWNISPPDRFR